MNATEFAWSTRNQQNGNRLCPDGYWGVFYYSPGSGMATGEKCFYGKNFWADEQAAIRSQQEWEARHLEPAPACAG